METEDYRRLAWAYQERENMMTAESLKQLAEGDFEAAKELMLRSVCMGDYAAVFQIAKNHKMGLVGAKINRDQERRDDSARERRDRRE